MHLSSATVYGAWPDNQIPLTEDSPLRPNPEFAYAVGKAEAERALAEWAEDHPETKVAVLRPAVTVGSPEPLYQALGATNAPGAGDGAAPGAVPPRGRPRRRGDPGLGAPAVGRVQRRPRHGRSARTPPGRWRVGWPRSPCPSGWPTRWAPGPGSCGAGAFPSRPGPIHPSLGHRPGPSESGRLDTALFERRGAGGDRPPGPLGRPAARAAARTTTWSYRSR